MKNRNVLISGASVAGPALAYWLSRYGFTPTVVERAPALREGGFAVDFRGAAHLTVLDRMGILDEVRRQQTGMGAVSVIDAAGSQLASVPSHVMSGEIEIERGDLSRILYDLTAGSVEYRFGDSITSLTDGPGGVDVTFENGPPRTFDLVIGADGLHSNVRGLRFGPEAEYVRDLGYHVAGFTAANDFGLDHTGLVYNEPGRGVSLSGNRHPDQVGVLFFFAGDRFAVDRRDTARQKAMVAEVYAGMGWKVPGLVEAMRTAPDFYFDSISQVRIDRYSDGRVALVGDAAYGATCGGLGTGSAIVGAYVLAGELAAAGGDHRTAFTRYEERIRKYAAGCQKISDGVGPYLAPATETKIRRRNRTYRVLNSRVLGGFFNRMTTRAASAITLPDYAREVSTSTR